MKILVIKKLRNKEPFEDEGIAAENLYFLSLKDPQ